MSDLGAAWRSRAVQALLGPSRSPLVPSLLWIGFLDGAGALVAMSGTSVTHDVRAPTADGVTNAVLIDAGTAGSGWTFSKVGLFDAPSGGDLMLAASLPAPQSPAEGEPLSIASGALTFAVA